MSQHDQKGHAITQYVALVALVLIFVLSVSGLVRGVMEVRPQKMQSILYSVIAFLALAIGMLILTLFRKKLEHVLGERFFVALLYSMIVVVMLLEGAAEVPWVNGSLACGGVLGILISVFLMRAGGDPFCSSPGNG